MNLPEKTGNFLKNVQRQPESTRKIILWSVVIVVGLVLFFLWLHITEVRLKNFQKGKIFQNLGTPNFQEGLGSVPAMELPEAEAPQLNEQDLNELNNALEQSNQQEPASGTNQ